MIGTFYAIEVYYTGVGWCQNWDTVTLDYNIARNYYWEQYREHPDNRVRIARFVRTVAGVPKRNHYVKQ